MFAAALIVFRESLEAALFIGIVAAATRQLPGRNRWLAAGVGCGALGALLLALAADHVGSWFDGLGQDFVNILVLSVALVMLLWHCIWVSAHAREMATEARRLGESVQLGQRKPWVLFAAISLAVLREGAETILFIGGSLSGSTSTAGEVLAAVAVGLGLGVLAGWIIYSGLARIPTRHLFTVTNTLIALLAGAIASQLAKAMAQAGLIDRWTTPLWDTSRALAPDSPVGVMLHALVGYDATPSAAQIASYAAVLLVIYSGSRLLQQRLQPGH